MLKNFSPPNGESGIAKPVTYPSRIFTFSKKEKHFGPWITNTQKKEVIMGLTSFRALVVEEAEDHRFTTRIATKVVLDLSKGEVLIKVHYSLLNFKDALYQLLKILEPVPNRCMILI
ncbi:MAG: hypothetical protein C4519_00220 [Desulfobacteraceae bacterium]|nr:MAG: hypothetical protein C4519_00220 [Desulfobacteraceae bacterium]